MRTNVLEALVSLHGIPVENPVLPGTCDVNYVEGWIELKQMKRWTGGYTGVFLIEHFTPQQRVFLHKRARKNGNVWLLLQVGKEFLMFHGEWAQQYVGRVSESELRAGCEEVWSSVEEMKEKLATWLTANRRV